MDGNGVLNAKESEKFLRIDKSRVDYDSFKNQTFKIMESNLSEVECYIVDVYNELKY